MLASGYGWHTCVCRPEATSTWAGARSGWKTSGRPRVRCRALVPCWSSSELTLPCIPRQTSTRTILHKDGLVVGVATQRCAVLTASSRIFLGMKTVDPVKAALDRYEAGQAAEFGRLRDALEPPRQAQDARRSSSAELFHDAEVSLSHKPPVPCVTASRMPCVCQEDL